MTVGELIKALGEFEILPDDTVVMIPDDLVRAGWSYLGFVSLVDGRLYLEGSGVED